MWWNISKPYMRPFRIKNCLLCYNFFFSLTWPQITAINSYWSSLNYYTISINICSQLTEFNMFCDQWADQQGEPFIANNLETLCFTPEVAITSRYLKPLDLTSQQTNPPPPLISIFPSSPPPPKPRQTGSENTLEAFRAIGSCNWGKCKTCFQEKTRIW